MKFGYAIAYVPDVAASVDFFAREFAIECRFLHESGDYGELQTGDTTLAFASHALGQRNLPLGYVQAHASPKPLGMEIALISADVALAHQRALQAGASELAAPVSKPWGQVVSYLRSPDGILIELCSPLA